MKTTTSNKRINTSQNGSAPATKQNGSATTKNENTTTTKKGQIRSTKPDAEQNSKKWISDEDFVFRVAMGQPIIEIVRQFEIPKRTAYRRAKEPGVQKQVQELRDAAFSQGKGFLCTLFNDALQKPTREF